VSYEASFGNLDTDGPQHRPPERSTPLRIAILADLAGRANRGEIDGSDTLVQRRAIKVNFDNLDDVIESLAPQLRVPIAGGATSVTLEFTELDDFHADPVYKQVDLIEEVVDLRDELSSAAEGSQVVAKVRRWAESASHEAAPRRPARGFDVPIAGSLAEIAEIAAQPADHDAEDLEGDELMVRAVGPNLTDAGDASGEKLAERTGEAAVGLMRQVLHDADFQALEATWRGLHWLLRRIHKNTAVQVVLYDVTAEEFAADLAGAEDLSETGIYQMLVAQVANTPDADPWALLVGNYSFDLQAPHAELLGRMGKIAAAAGAPFLAAVNARVVDETLELDDDAQAAWEALRELPEAAYVGLATPRFLLRPPYGDDFKPVESFAFTEFDGQPTGYLWGNPALLCAALVAGSFKKSGWRLKPGQQLSLDGMPIHVHRDEDDEELGVCAEVRFTSAASQHLVQWGLMPVLSVKGRDVIEVACMRSLAAEAGPLAGLWSDSAGVPAAAAAEEEDEASVSVGVQAAVESSGATTGDAGDTVSSADARDDPEVDDGLAALLAESEDSSDDDDDDDDDDDLSFGGDDNDDSSSFSLDDDDDDSSSSSVGDDDDDDDSSSLDDLLGGLSSGDDEEDSSDDDGMDPDLAALLGDDVDADDEETDDTDSDADMDPELTALLSDDDEDEDENALETETTADTDVSSDMATTADEPSAAADDTEQPASDTQAATEDLDTLIERALQLTRPAADATGGLPLLELRSLLRPIPGDNPAGAGIPYDVRERLDQARREVNPEDFDPDDPMRPDDAVYADWQGIVALCQTTLTTTSKNLLIGARLLEALTMLHGFAGLRDGIQLMRLMVDVCWDRLDPEIEDEDDLEVRAAPFNWLDDPDRGACFPNSVRDLPLVRAGGKSFSWQDWQRIQESRDDADPAGFEGVVMQATRADCQAVHDEIHQALSELQAMTDLGNRRLGAESPGFTYLRPALQDCYSLARQILQKKPAEPGDDTDDQITEGQPEGGEMTTARPRLSNRDEVYRQLAEAAGALQRLEPHSPVPYLIQRAVHLGAMPFPQLIQELVRDATIIAEMNRELGIREEQAPGQ